MTPNNINRLKQILDRLSADDGNYICSVVNRDPFADIYALLLIIYFFMLIGFLLWPFDFFSFVKNDAQWLGNSRGIEFLRIGQAVSKSSTQEFYDRLVKGRGLTVELWLQTEDLNQIGPARILTFSINPSLRNFTVGQSQDKLVVRLRTSRTDFNGIYPHLIIDHAFNNKGLQHFVIMYDFVEQRVYINGELKAQSEVLKGDFSNWERICSLVIGNEATGDRPWKGKIYYAAIYARPLTEEEIRQSYLLTPWHKKNTDFPLLLKKNERKHTAFKEGGPIVR